MTLGVTRKCEQDLLKKLTCMVQEHGFRGAYRASDADLAFSVDDLSFWLNPLKSAVTEISVLYHVIVTDNRLSVHPKRVVPLYYNIASKELSWLR
jgi:hypothetical protein